ncbi:MAG: ABC transporter ATP-binding protein [Ruminococcaceae bacterium]|nr:ABC transporter ATP-binding protein [Oscillospiraceae bacterium]
MTKKNNEAKAILRITDVTHSFDGKIALDNVSFEVYEGEFLAILGPSGCGKTTILRNLIGLLFPDEGKIYLDDKDITCAAPSERDMGIVFQNYALFENMTVLQNVQYAMKFRKDMKADSKKLALDMLERMGLSEHANKKPNMLSGGQQQRVAIARTLVLHPRVILFDEPMSALDVETRLSLRKEIKQIQAEFGTTMIYITHDQEEAFAMADRIMVMDNSKIVQLDTPINIIKNPADAYVQRFVLDNLQTKIDSLAKYIDV